MKIIILYIIYILSYIFIYFRSRIIEYIIKSMFRKLLETSLYCSTLKLSRDRETTSSLNIIFKNSSKIIILICNYDMIAFALICAILCRRAFISKHFLTSWNICLKCVKNFIETIKVFLLFFFKNNRCH